MVAQGAPRHGRLPARESGRIARFAVMFWHHALRMMQIGLSDLKAPAPSAQFYTRSARARHIIDTQDYPKGGIHG